MNNLVVLLGYAIRLFIILWYATKTVYIALWYYLGVLYLCDLPLAFTVQIDSSQVVTPGHM